VNRCIDHQALLLADRLEVLTERPGKVRLDLVSCMSP
jgi:hypothetical protein